jgi:hypothetical protein
MFPAKREAKGAIESPRHIITTALRLALTLGIILSLGIVPSVADDRGNATDGQISPFWGSAITQWNRWIVFWANERELDPDLVAAVIRQESIGRANAEGPYGAVGLMMVMPAEVSGLSWRPSAEELKQPNINLRWGTGMLRQIVRDSNGDLIRSLAAYNGGWEQVHLPVTERYAHSILTFYAYAIAARHGYSYQESKSWTLILMTRVDGRIKLIQTSTSGPFLVPCFEDALGFRDIFPDMVTAPRTRVAHFVDQDGHDVLLDAWLFVGDPGTPTSENLVSVDPPIPPQSGHRP